MKSIIPFPDLSKQVQIMFVATLTAYSLLGIHSHGAEQKITVLAPMTIFAKRNDDNTITQYSEVQWQQSNDLSIKKERDGSYTASDRSNPYNIKSLILSLGSPALNIDIRYARNSASMTADGRLALKTLTDSFSHLEKGTTILVSYSNKNTQTSNTITSRRIDAVHNIFEQNSKLDFEFNRSKNISGIPAASKRFDSLRIQVQRKM